MTRILVQHVHMRTKLHMLYKEKILQTEKKSEKLSFFR